MCKSGLILVADSKFMIIYSFCRNFSFCRYFLVWGLFLFFWFWLLFFHLLCLFSCLFVTNLPTLVCSFVCSTQFMQNWSVRHYFWKTEKDFFLSKPAIKFNLLQTCDLFSLNVTFSNLLLFFSPKFNLLQMCFLLDLFQIYYYFFQIC